MATSDAVVTGEKPPPSPGRSQSAVLPPSEAPDRESGQLSRLVMWVAVSGGVIVAIVGIWWLVVIAFSIPRAVLPSPDIVARTLYSNRGYLWANARPTILESAVGYVAAVIVAIPLGFLLSRKGPISTAMNAGVLSLQIFPKVAIAPLFVIWFGFGYFPKFLFVFLLGFFPIAISAAAGFSSAPKELRDLGRVLGMSKWDQARKLLGPNALPQIFTGMKVSAAFTMVAAIVYEFVGANSGLGYLITASESNIDTPLMFAALIWVTVLGFAFYGIVVALEAIAIPWHVSKRH